MNKRAAVIGAGIIGATCAYELKKHAYDVVVIDPEHHESAPSKYNAGGLGYAEVLPIASGSILRKVPKWLIDPVGPLSIKPGYLPKAMPWFVRFVLASKQIVFRESVRALARLNLLSRELCQPLYEAAGISSAIRPVGALHLYETEQEFRRALPGWKLRADNGIKFRHIGQGELLAMEPGLAPVFTGATLLEDWHLVSDPEAVLSGITQLGQKRGVDFIHDSVVGIQSRSGKLQVLLEYSDNIQVDQVVLAAGAWSGPLAKTLGDRIPLEAERGYNTTIPNNSVSINRELIFGEHGFVATQLDCGLRIGGGAEFAGLNEPPNYARASAMLEKARRFLPRLRADGGTEWMGCRPAIPDSRPVIGRATRQRQVLYAFGHGHLGLTQAPATAHLIAQLALEQQPSIDVKPYSPERFA
ncbi:MAG: FAD-binding oxidoreductase [Arenicellales bacterium]|nr:FAD-binding oxidoreductase [Arenicellales bacterium]